MTLNVILFLPFPSRNYISDFFKQSIVLSSISFVCFLHICSC